MWNLGFNLALQVQALALIVAGAVLAGLAGIGVIVAIGATIALSQVVAGFGLAAEVARVSVAHPSRPTVSRCVRATVMQSPIALVLAPVVYLLLGPGGATPFFLAVIGIYAAVSLATAVFVSLLNGLGDFRSPALSLGSTRVLFGTGAVAAVAFEPNVTVVIGTLAIGECLGLAGLSWAIHVARKPLTTADHPEGKLKRARGWLGLAVIINLLTSQGDTLLVASILSPQALGIFAIASTLQNGVTTLSLAPPIPFAYKSLSATLQGDRAAGAKLLRKSVLIAAGTAAVIATMVSGAVLFLADNIGKLAPLAVGDGPLVLTICLAAAPMGVVGTIWMIMGAGFSRHRTVGLYQIGLGIWAGAAIIAGAIVAGAVGAALGTIVRDATRLAFNRRLAVPPENVGKSQVAVPSTA